MPLLTDLAFDYEDPQNGTPVPYCPFHLIEEAYAGPTGSLGYEQGSGFVMSYVVPWVYHARFCQLILGLNYVDSDGTQERLMRLAPHAFPVEGYTNLYATGIQQVSGIAGADPYEYISGSSGPHIIRPTFGFISNDTNAGNYLRYAYAKVTVQYGPYPYTLYTDEATPYDKEWQRYTTIQRTPRVEFLNVQLGSLYWIGQPAQAVPHAVPVRDQSVDYVVTWHRVPFVITDFDAFIGFSNSVSGFLDGHPQAPVGGFDEDRMLLVGVQETLVPQPWSAANDEQLYTYAFFFQDKFNGHNQGLRVKGSGTTATCEYEPFSFTAQTPTLNSQRAIKHANMANLFAAR